MTRLEIYIDEQLVDIDDRTRFSFNLKGNDIQALTTRGISYTGAIRLPFTKRNDKIFKGARHVANTTSFPYVKQRVAVVLNGVHILPDALHILTRVRDGYEIRILDNEANFFETIKGKKLSDLTSLNGLLLLGFDATANASNGVVSPVINYGNWSPGDIHKDSYLPSIYYATVIAGIFEDNGFQHFGRPFANWKHLKTIIPYSKSFWGYSEKFVTDRTAVVSKTIQQGPTLSQPAISLSDWVTFNVVEIQDPKGFWAFNQYTGVDPDAPIGTGLSFATFKLDIDLSAISGGTVDLVMWDNTTEHLLGSNLGTGVYALESAPLSLVSVAKNVSWRLVVKRNTGTPTYTIASAKLRVQALNIPNVWTYFSDLLPDITQEDFIKDFVIRSGAIFGGKGTDIELYFVQDIINKVGQNVTFDLTTAEEYPSPFATVPASPWTLGASPSVFTSPTFQDSNYLAIPYPTRGGRSYTIDWNISFGANGTSWAFETMNEHGAVVTLDSVPEFDTITKSGQTTFVASGNAVFIAIRVSTGGLSQTSSINSLSISEDEAQPIFEDWSSKRVNPERSDDISFLPLTFAQKNLFQFKNVDELFDESLYKASMDIANLNALLEKNIYTSVFNASDTQVLDGINMLQVPIYEMSLLRTEFDKDPSFRLALVRNKRASEPAVIFNTSQSKYKVAYFFDQIETLSLKPDTIVSENYSALRAALQKAKIVQRDYLLSEVDIANFRFNLITFDQDQAFLKMAVSTYVPGSPVTVTLLKL